MDEMDEIEKKADELQEMIKKLKLKHKQAESNESVPPGEDDLEKLRNDIQQKDERIRALEDEVEEVNEEQRESDSARNQLNIKMFALKEKYEFEASEWQAEKAKLQRQIKTPVEALEEQLRAKDEQIEILQQQQQKTSDDFVKSLLQPRLIVDDPDGKEAWQMATMEVLKPRLRIREIPARIIPVLPTAVSEPLFPSVEMTSASTTNVMSLLLDCIHPGSQGRIPNVDILLWIYEHVLPELRPALLHSPTDYHNSLLSCILDFVLIHMIGARGKATATALCSCILVELYAVFDIPVDEIKGYLVYDVTKHSALEAASILRLKMALRDDPAICNSERLDMGLSPKDYYTGFSDPRFKDGIVKETQLATLPLPEFLVAVRKQPMVGPRAHHEWFVSNDDYIMIAHQGDLHCFVRQQPGWIYHPRKPILHTAHGGTMTFSMESTTLVESAPAKGDIWKFVATFNNEKAAYLFNEEHKDTVRRNLELIRSL